MFINLLTFLFACFPAKEKKEGSAKKSKVQKSNSGGQNSSKSKNKKSTANQKVVKANGGVKSDKIASPNKKATNTAKNKTESGGNKSVPGNAQKSKGVGNKSVPGNQQKSEISYNAAPITFEEYVKNNKLEVQGSPVNEKGKSKDKGKGKDTQSQSKQNQSKGKKKGGGEEFDGEGNVLEAGYPSLVLVGKGLTDLRGIAKAQVTFQGKTVPISQVKGLVLFLNHNRIKELPPELFELTNLSGLFLSGNQLSSIPESISRLKSLLFLFFSENPGINGRIPEAVFTLRTLTKLALDGCNLNDNSIKNIGNLTNLRHLDLSHNKIENLPESIGNLRYLKVFSLSYNNLRALPASLSRLNISHIIRVDNNPNLSDSNGVLNKSGSRAFTDGTRIGNVKNQASHDGDKENQGK